MNDMILPVGYICRRFYTRHLFSLKKCQFLEKDNLPVGVLVFIGEKLAVGLRVRNAKLLLKKFVSLGAETSIKLSSVNHLPLDSNCSYCTYCYEH